MIVVLVALCITTSFLTIYTWQPESKLENYAGNIKPFNIAIKSTPDKDSVIDIIESATFRKHLRSRQKIHLNLTKSYFLCNDQSSVFALLNDDYCDCIDGSDEPLTSACSMILVSKHMFPCPGSARGTVLFPSRVHDGVTDCSDGADEV